MKNEKSHLVPQVVIDCAEGLASTRQDNLRLNYVMRLEAIRDYCDRALKASHNPISATIKRRNVSR